MQAPSAVEEAHEWSVDDGAASDLQRPREEFPVPLQWDAELAGSNYFANAISSRGLRKQQLICEVVRQILNP